MWMTATPAKPMQAPQTWGEIPTVRTKRPRLQLGEPVLARPALAPGAVTTQMPVPTTFPRSGRCAFAELPRDEEARRALPRGPDAAVGAEYPVQTLLV
jgi:hypothetical protein